MRGISIGFLFLLCFKLNCFSQEIRFSHTIVESNNDVTLYWQGTSLPANYHYQIYFSLALNGTYSLLYTTTGLTTTAYTHANASGNTQKNYYMIIGCDQTNPNGLPKYYSDTVSNIHLNGLVGGKVAVLSWSSYPSGSYEIEKKIDIGTWKNIAYTSEIQHLDTVTNCGDSISYRILMMNASGNKSISGESSNFFKDETRPLEPLLDTVSINPLTGQTELGWERSASEDTYAYLIYLHQGVWNTIDTVYGAENTFYIDQNNNASQTSLQYCIAALDTCLNASPLGEFHHTLLLSCSGLDKCDSIVNFSWNKYDNMPGGVDSFCLYAKENNGNYIKIATLAGDKNNYTWKRMSTLSDYTCYVQARNSKNNYSASSNTVDVRFNRKLGTGNAFLRYVSVEDDQYIEIAAHCDDTIPFEHIRLYRSIDSGSTYKMLKEQPKSSSQTTHIFTDSDVNIYDSTYFYKVSLTDECDIEYVFSDSANNIILKSLESIGDENSMEWSPYHGFGIFLDSYEIYRKTQNETDFIFIQTEPIDTPHRHTDNVWDESLLNTGIFYYKVAAVQNPANKYGFEDYSFSNSIGIQKELTTYIPNAFYPESNIEKNKIFKPVNVYVDNADYTFSIYDRWGNRVFRTHNTDEGWDGTIENKIANPGPYSYYLFYKINEEESFEKKGSFLLVR